MRGKKMCVDIYSEGCKLVKIWDICPLGPLYAKVTEEAQFRIFFEICRAIYCLSQWRSRIIHKINLIN